MADFRLAFIADIHHYSEKLGNSGRAYELREGSDQKCLKETGAILDTVFAKFAAEDTDCVCIAGDITNDGEKVSHDEVLAKFLHLNEKKKLYLITSTHDWCSDHNPRRFEGNEIFNDVETLSAEELTNYYTLFGEKDCIASYKTPIGLVSRCFQVCPGLRLLAVHDDCDAKGGKSGYSEAHLQWMADQLKKAEEDGCKTIAMEHHLLLHPFCKLVNSGQSIGENFEVAAFLADHGLRLMFVGHSHMQRTTEFVSEKGNKITQINLGSLTGYPAPVTYVDFDGENAKVNVEFIKEFTYNGEKCDFEYFKKHTLGVLFNLLEAGKSDKQDFYERLRANGIKIPSYDLLYPIIRFICKKLLRAHCGGAGRLINFFTFGKGIDRKALKAIKRMPLLELVSKVFLSIFDGSVFVKDASAAEKKVVCSVGTLPSRIVKKLPLNKDKKEKILKTTDQIEALTKELMYPSEPDNMNTVIAL
ncbi:MAG: metallophosphoesterase [Clostridia bacterium]|nr:metallophosphoesterase [Clostridia bacterium]